ncbi:MAG: trypsin-like serine protease [Pseudobdellovibrionaceae bacterium]
MRSILAALILIFVSGQAVAVMSAIEVSGRYGEAIRKSAVNLALKDSTGEYSTRCSSALVGRRHVLTAFHCVNGGGSLWHKDLGSANRFVEFFVKDTKNPKYIKIKSIDYPQALKDIHVYGRELYYLMGDLEEKSKREIINEARLKLIIKLGGDVQELGENPRDSEFEEYIKTLLSSRSQEEQRSLFEEFSKESSEEAMGERIVSESLPVIEKFLKDHGFNEGYAAFEKFASDQDLALLTLEEDAPKNYTPVRIGEADLREGTDLKGWIAGSGAFGKVGDQSLQVNHMNGKKKIRHGTVKVNVREGNHFLLRAGPSRICHGDSGGPLYVEDGKNLVLVGIHSAVSFASKQEHWDGISQCTADVPTISMDLSKFKDLLKPVL